MDFVNMYPPDSVGQTAEAVQDSEVVLLPAWGPSSVCFVLDILNVIG